MDRKLKEKELRHTHILQSSEKLFIEKGYFNTTIDELAVGAEYTKRSLYRYFASKEDIYFAIASRNFKELLAEISEGFNEEGNGLQKMEKGMESFKNFFHRKFDKFLLLAGARTINVNEDKSKYHGEILMVQQNLLELFIKTIIIGQSDGSMKKDINPFMSAHFLLASVISLFSELALNKEKLEKHLPYSLDDFINHSMNMYILVLKS